MADSLLNLLFELMGGAFSLSQAAFRAIVNLPNGHRFALVVVLAAGLSLGIGQSVILFVNRIKPLRFCLSLLLNAILFAFGFLFLVFSTWLIGLLPGFARVPWGDLVDTLGLSYTPLLFSFLGAMPYLGVPILNLLSVWHLLAMVTGISAIAGVGSANAFTHVVLGWVVLQLLQGTIGQPIAELGRRMSRRVAGVDLVRRRSEVVERVQSGLAIGTPANGAQQADRLDANNREVSEGISKSISEGISAAAVSGSRLSVEPSQPIAEPGLQYGITAQASGAAALQLPSQDTETLGVRLENRVQGIPQIVRLAFILLGMVLLFVLVALLLRPIRLSLFGWYDSLPRFVRWIFDLSWIGIVALVFAGLLAPLETLGWWAGWFGDDLETQAELTVAPSQPSGAATASAALGIDRPDRYVVYLDGVGQSGEAYTPDIEDFLEALQPALPKNMELVRGLMLYSVRNQALVSDRPLAWVWRLADQMRWENPMALLGLMVNVRNAWIVAVSADKRYGPIYNQGIAQVIYNGLIRHGYQPGEGIPITLVGYSGGAQMSVASAPYLRRALEAEIEVISLGGVMSANNNFLKLEHLYHLVGDQDVVERLGPLLFPGRRKWFPLSYWNRAMRKGKISEISLGPMGHQVPGGIMDPNAYLPDGQSHLQKTIAQIRSILKGNFLVNTPPRPRQTSNYERYKQAEFNSYTYYPLAQTVDPQWYQPIAPWMGRLILPQPNERRLVRGVWFEVHHAPAGYESLVGQKVMLRWADHPAVKQWVRAVTHNVHFSVDAQYSSQYGGTIHPDRLNHWQQVGPLESLAGSHPVDDVVVMLVGDVEVGEWMSGRVDEWMSGRVDEWESQGEGQARDEESNSASANLASIASSTHPPIHPSTHPPILSITHTPSEITGRYYGLVQFEAPLAGSDRFQVRHFNRASRQFDGWAEGVRLPAVVLAQCYGSFPSTSEGLERSPLNETGWYIYGAKDATGTFVVQALAPRSLFRLQPDRVVFGRKASYRYIRQESWSKAVEQKGRIASVLCVGRRQTEDIRAAVEEWQVGDRVLVLHVYGGIGGNKKEPAAATPIFFGHFAYGVATVVHDPISDERRFEIQYYQVYTHNTDGINSGTLHWSRYMGDRQFGWAGTRPVCDILVKFDPFTGDYDIDGTRRSPLDNMIRQLEAMTARYRIGDGTGATYVGPANNCSQDANQALFASIRSLSQQIEANQSLLRPWLEQNPDRAMRYEQLLAVKEKLAHQLQPFGSPRSDWETNEFKLGTTLEDDPLRNLWIGLGSWRTLLPRKASDAIVKAFLEQGASVWVLRTNQIGGHDPDIEPIAPMTL
ncbi:CAAX protease [Leptolyngbya ohadii]|uniref:CAAX protease n=1 Tax=Leptolyngbya ohadii TaxID=1962290 RepID=UPI000B5A07D7|nr:CAAX protease [Leptolyngbya ohadii]